MRKMNLKQVVSMLMLFGLFLIGFQIETVHAKVEDARFYEGNYISGIYFKKMRNGVSYYETARFLNRADGQFAYCIQPFVEFVNGKLQIAYDSDYTLVTGMTDAQWERVALLSYYGYQYQNHTEAKWYAITQLLIWKTVDPNHDMFFTSTLNGNRVSLYETEIAELEQLVANHKQVPTFVNQEYTISIGQTLTLTDDSGILSEYTITNDDNIELYVARNQLTISAKQHGIANIKLEKQDQMYSHVPIVYVDNQGQNVLVAGSYQSIVHMMRVNVVGGRIRLTKVDDESQTTVAQGEATLVGAIYDIYDSMHYKVDTLVIGEDKTALSSYLPLGQYTIQEVASSNGYEVNPTIYDVTITSDSIIDVKVEEHVIKGTIKLIKVDSETKTCQAQGEATLVGAEYGIYDKQNHLVDKITIGANCTAESKLLPYGTYEIRELSAPNGYLLNEKKMQLSVTNNKVYTVTVKDDVIRNQIEIYKFYGSTGTMQVEPGARFSVINTKQEVVATIETNQEGYAKLELPYGDYTIQQIAGMDGYLYIKPFSISVRENTNSVQTYYLKDEPFMARLKLVKVDSNTKQPIGKAKFKIKNEKTGKYICQTTNEIICEFETNADGVLITPLPLESGDYSVEEIKAPYGYLIAESPIVFSIRDNEQLTVDFIYGPLLELVFENQPAKGKVEIHKIGEKIVIESGTYYYQSQPLENVQFGLYDAEGNLVTILSTNESGYAVVENLPLGFYTLKELQSVQHHMRDESGYEFILEYQNDSTPIITKEFILKNYLPKGQLRFQKIDANTKEAISDTEITIYTENHQCIFQGKTGEDGVIIVPNLSIGRFYIVETKSKYGYQIRKDKIYFEVKNHNETVEVIMENEKITGTLEFMKVEKNTNIPLENVEIEIYTIQGDLVANGVTDIDGKIIIDNLAFGNYYLIEKKTLDGYLLNPNKFYFEIKENEEVVTLVMENEKIGEVLGEEKEILIEVPNTLLVEYNLNYLFRMVLIMIGIGFVIYGKS